MANETLRIDLTARDSTAAAFSSLQNSLAGVNRSLSTVTSAFAAFRGAALGGAALAGFVKYSDELTNLTNRLKASGVEAAELATVQDRLFKIAERSRSSVQDVGQLYAKLTMASKDLGASQNDVATATEVITKSLKMSGATTQEVQSSVLQLGQALASGRLGGDELRSLLESAPQLARLIATEFGVSVGQLKELGSQGSLEASRVFAAIVKGAPEVNRVFAETDKTFADYVTSATNVVLGYLAAVQKLGQYSPIVKKALQEQAAAEADAAKASGRTGREELEKDLVEQKLKQVEGTKELIRQQSQLAASLRDLADATAAAQRNPLPFGTIEEQAQYFRILGELKTADAEKAAQLREELRTLGESYPRFDNAFSKLDALAGAIGVARRAVEDLFKAFSQGPNLAEISPPKFQSRVDKNADDAFIRSQEEATQRVLKEKEAYAALSDEQRKFVDKQKELRKLAGGFATEDQISASAKRIIASEEANKGGGGRGKTDEIERFAETLQKTLDPTIQFNKEIDQLFQAIDRGLIPADKAAEAFTLIGERTLEAANKAKDSKSELEGMFKGVESAVMSVGSKFGDALGEMVTGGKVDFKQLADSIIKDLIRIATQILIMQPLIDSLKTAFKGGDSGSGLGIGDGIKSFFSGIFGLPGKAVGGPVSASSAYLVGEKGPELFVPGRSGSIMPNGMGGAAPVVNVNVENHAGAEIGVRQSRGPNGLDIQVIVEQAVIKSMNGGAIGRQLAGYGVNRMNAR